MATMKYSKQRESIKKYLMHTKEHPTADTVYTNVRDIYPNISLGTVYRNLNLLSDLKEIQKISCGDGCDRFDGNPAPHYHFICNDCNRVFDIDMPSLEEIDRLAGQSFDGTIDGHIAYFYGKCPECMNNISEK